jgi:hypothetical protein
MITGYMHPGYAESFTEFGKPRFLPKSGGWILVRQIPSFKDVDAMGCYPLFVCQDWSNLYTDLADLSDELVSLSLVTDPFGRYDTNLLYECFDIAMPFKEHFVTDLSKPMDVIVSSHHRYYARKALKNISVELCEDPTRFIDEWMDLYGILIKRHNIEGIRAFSRRAFVKQLSIPGLVMFRALYQGATVGAYMWYVQDEVSYGHLGSINSVGQELMASYAIFWTATEYFADKVCWIDHGADAGNKNNGKDGLTQFKRGWSSDTRTVYFCGRILNHIKYDEIVKATGISATDYFPAYRKGTF